MKIVKNFNYKKTIMILGAAYSQMPLYEAARRLKIKSVAVSCEGEYPGFDLADEVLKIDVKDKEAICRMAEYYDINGIATCGNDWGIESLGYVCEKLHLNGPSEKACGIGRNKYKMKQAFSAGNVLTPKCAKVADEVELEAELMKFSFPVIIKAADLMGGRGVFCCVNIQEARQAFRAVLLLSECGYALLEEYIDGICIGVEGICENGELVAMLANNTISHGNTVKIPVGHSIPLDNEVKYRKLIKTQVELAIKASGFDNCPFNIDCIISNNKVYIIEMTARPGANGLCELMSLHYGIDYYEAVLLLSLGENITELFSHPDNKAYSTGLNACEDSVQRMLPLIKTPIQKLSHIKGPNCIYCKREDYIPFSYGGTKVRIADYILQDISRINNPALIMYGGYQSNLCRILAKACNERSIPCYLIVNADDGPIDYDTLNAGLIIENDVKEYICRKNNISQVVTEVIAEVEQSGLNPYYIYGSPYGTGNEKTMLSAGIDLYREIETQEKEMNISFDYIFLAGSSNMTQSGLLAGKIFNHGKETIVGISVNRQTSRAKTEINKNLQTLDLNDNDIQFYDGSLFDGYGKYDEELLNFCTKMYDLEGLPLDPIYVGKGFFGMLKYIEEKKIKNKNILFIHTGGRPLFIETVKNRQ